jgi:serine/threonine protein kinase
MSFDVDPPPGYELEERLGDGGMGVVYRARQRSSGGRVVALKRVRVAGDGRLRTRIQREAEILASLDHPHIIRIYEFVPDGDGIAIAMQYAPGGSLADRLKAQTRLDTSGVIAFAAPIAQALASAHRRGVLHRDIKPGNILFTSDGEPLLSDFGIARWSQAERLTAQTGVQLGTAEYLDPEVANGCAPDERSDVYSLGLVCYEALTGRAPFTGPTPLSVLRAADQGEYTPLAEAAPDCPPPIAEVIERAMARTRKDRFASAAEFALALRRAEWSAQAVRRSHGTAARSSQLIPGVPPSPVLTAEKPANSSGPPPGPPPAAEPHPTRVFGPRPPLAKAPVTQAVRVPKVAVWTAAAVMVLLPVAVVLLLRDDQPSEARHTVVAQEMPPDPPPPDPRPPSCAPASPPLIQQGELVMSGDLDGDGCRAFVTWRGNLLTVYQAPDQPGPTYELGQPGDALLLGDWNCDRIDTPALYRPSTGEVFLFNQWTEPGQKMHGQVASRQVPDGTAKIVRGGQASNGCGDTVQVVGQSSRG